ncbi:M48 family metallopeptidase [Psychroserpens sp.]|uniref:M48 family metallopeptidase n=1 Tax=Psychroserpens sp. TaxID=2020870 RepID=UPI001B2CF899|nr:M48 family metallopeptidase [Psychroserpens sp.]MBO6607283.1 M48 family metallopeptidase [Psychroserpens sp.]MBO6631610.1 M48 family metallopeptidase [Psychroserpens sp.]MBO6654641.1 M48 family metallopeptidase [Psychroserpens sp.]MBO6681012.1 M48 family metallopeptidase [Psychroserpens sp.]MBO6750033.1 M48 family metallopeptidase [Psychroserpens sp.]
MSIKNKVVAIGTLAIFLSCATNPFTGKKTLALVSNNELFPTAFAQYDQFLSENNVVKGTSDAEMIQRVGQRIAVAAERWLDANGHQGYLKDYKWEYNLVNDKTVNAWCMPGGKIVFYTGILPIAQNETGIAAIMGHEVAHALANHGQQRMSAGMLQQLGAVAGNVAIKDQQSRDIFNQAYGVGSQVGVMLPFSRSHETQSDEIGIVLMAIAGYNPDEAAELWKRMQANSGGKAPPQFLSTHPSNESRINNLTSLAGKAKLEAKKFGVDSFRPLGEF